MAEALYRKYRPQVFADVVGQEPIERTLRNAIEQGKVSHAYLFCGPRGTGKTTTARLLAKALLCEHGPTPDPDGTCEDCRLIAEGTHPDVYELDAASRTGVENVREEVISRVQFAPTRGRYKIYIIDEVHMLSTAAFNALLKTLEEPPSHVVFILCTTDPQKVLETVHSRCQRFDFRRIAPESMVSRLGAICVAEGVEFEGEALDLIAHRADGGLRNALTSLEQIIAFENGKVTLEGAERLLGSIDANDMAEIISYIGRRDVANCFRWTADYIETGADLAQFVRDMAEHVRNMYVLSLAGDEVELDVSETVRRELVAELQWFGPDRIARLLGVLGDLTAELKTTANARLAFEIALTRMVRPDSDLTLEALAERVEALESGYSAVSHVLPGEPAARLVSASAVAVEPAASHMQPEAPRVSELQEGAAPVAEPVVAATATPAATPAPAREAKSAEGFSVFENPAAFQRVWQAALGILKKQKAAYGVLFLNTKARFNGEASRVEVEFPVENGFAFMTVQKPEVRSAVESSLAQAAGQHVPITFMQGAAPAAAANAAPAAVASAVSAATPSAPASAFSATVPVEAAPAQPTSASAPVRVVESEPVADEPYYEPVPYDEIDEYAIPDYLPYEPPAEPERFDAEPAPAPVQPAAAAPAGDIADLQAMLQAGFGGGITFTEVDE